jgi:HSP20 family protein
MTNIVRWEPFRDLVSMRSMTMDDLFTKGFVPFRGYGENGEGAYFPVDVSETTDELTVSAQLPGIELEHVDIAVHGSVLTIKGETEELKTSQDQNWHRREIHRGAFQRSFTLPSDVDADRANAILENGMLTLTLPKREDAKPKHIQVTGATETTSIR